MDFSITTPRPGVRRICVDGVCKDVAAPNVMFQLDGGILNISVSDPNASAIHQMLQAAVGAPADNKKDE